MALSDEHIQKHLKEWTDLYLDGGDSGGGGHAGMSLNVFCGLLHEPPLRVAKLALALQAKGIRPKKPYDAYWRPDGWHRFVPIRSTLDYLLPGGYDPYVKLNDDELEEITYTYFRPST